MSSQAIVTAELHRSGVVPFQAQLHAEHKKRRARIYAGIERSSETKAQPVSLPTLAIHDHVETISPADALVAEWKAQAKAVIAPVLKPAPAIAREVCSKHELSMDTLRTCSRTTPHVRARQELFYRLKTETNMSLPEIGRFCGGKDHTTVLHGHRMHAARLARGEAS